MLSLSFPGCRGGLVAKHWSCLQPVEGGFILAVRAGHSGLFLAYHGLKGGGSVSPLWVVAAIRQKV